MKKFFLLVILWLMMSCGCNDSGSLGSKKPVYSKVINAIEQGNISVPTNGLVQLPTALKEASEDGEVYISFKSSNRFAVVFQTWRGKGRNMEGFLYTSKPLSTSDVGTDAYGQTVFTIEFVDFTIEKQLNPNWYRVSFRLD